MLEVLSVFVLGLAVGSFLNVLIDRLPNEQSIVYPQSHCEHCKKSLAWYDLIPVVSFVFLLGRCRYCKKPIGWQYPFVELITGVLFIAVFIFGMRNHELGIMNIGTLGYDLFIISSLIVIFFADLKYGIIPDKIIFPGIAVSIAYLFITHNSLFIIHILSALGAFLFFLAIYMLTRGRGMGFGDVKLAGLLGLFFGFPTIVFVLYAAFLTGGAFSIILLLLGKKKLKGTVAFGPFLVVASLSIFFFKEQIASLLWFLPAVLL